MNKIIFSTFLLLSLLFDTTAHARNPGDEYYSDNIFQAIDAAKNNPHHYDYSGRHRYNRSTKQSIDLRRLKNQEMAKKTIKSDSQTIVTNASISQAEQDNETQVLQKRNKSTNTKITEPSINIPQAVPAINHNVNNQSTINVIAR